MKPTIERLSSTYAFRSPWMDLRVDQVRLANGDLSTFSVVERRPFVLAIIKRDNEVLMVRQYRYPIDAWTWEFPQGARDPDEDPEHAARREICEETGCIIDDLRLVGHLYEAAGFATQDFHIFEATLAREQAQELEPSELGLTAQWVPIQQLAFWARHGEFRDAPSLAAFALWRVVSDGGA